GLQQIQFFNRLGEDSRSVPPGAVGDDGKLKVAGLVVQLQGRPGVLAFPLNLHRIGEKGTGITWRLRGRKNSRQRRDRQRRQSQKDSVHVPAPPVEKRIESGTAYITRRSDATAAESPFTKSRSE